MGGWIPFFWRMCWQVQADAGKCFRMQANAGQKGQAGRVWCEFGTSKNLKNSLPCVEPAAVGLTCIFHGVAFDEVKRVIRGARAAPAEPESHAGLSESMGG